MSSTKVRQSSAIVLIRFGALVFAMTFSRRPFGAVTGPMFGPNSLKTVTNWRQ